MYILFDIGGSKMRIAYSKDGKNFEEPLRFDTPKTYKEGLELIVKTAHSFCSPDNKEIQAVAGGIAGTPNPERSCIVHSPHLDDWVNQPLKNDLESALQAPVCIENDSAVVALGEAEEGAGKGYNIVVYITISTGVGGARIVGMEIDRSVYGFEPGHQHISVTGIGTSVPTFISIEDLISGTAIEARFGKKPHLVEDPAVWEELSLWLAHALHNSILHWSPDVVVLGGSMITGSPAISVDKTREHLGKIMAVYPKLPDIKQAVLKDIGGIHGACALLKRKGVLVS